MNIYWFRLVLVIGVVVVYWLVVLVVVGLFIILCVGVKKKGRIERESWRGGGEGLDWIELGLWFFVLKFCGV